MNILNKGKKYNWNFCTIGGVTRVNIVSGEDIAHLCELDRKLWTVLSCPVNGLEFDPLTLSLLDSDHDGKIHVDEVIATSKWLTKVINDPDLLIEGKDYIPLTAFNTEDEEGRKLRSTAEQILRGLKTDKDSISVADTASAMSAFFSMKFNGDGIITPDAADTPVLKKAIQTIIDTCGGKTDRSGSLGVDEELVGKFFSQCLSYSQWKEKAEADSSTILPFGGDTETVLSLVEQLKDKISDYFMRCSLSSFDTDATSLLDVPLDSVKTLSTKDLSKCTDEIASYPIARVNPEGYIPMDALNPVWRDSLSKLVTIAFPEGVEELSAEQWNKVLAAIAPYKEWKDSNGGEEVSTIDVEYARELLSGAVKTQILSLIAEDKALEGTYDEICAVDNLLHIYRDFFQFLRNFVTLSDFYDRNVKAIFQAGRLYIDQRACDLCLKVSDMGKQGEMASLSNMFLVFCKCTSKLKGQTMDIVAAVTEGDVNDLREGKNAIFYDRDGGVWDAVVTKLVDNPIGIGQAFWSPYRKLGNFINEQINKFASDKEAKVTEEMNANVLKAEENIKNKEVPAPHTKQPVDIAKFAGIFAALGLALGAIGTFLTSLITGFAALKWWQMVVAVAAVMLVISGPSMIKAWLKLRKRNLSPILNANGWAVNAKTLVNIKFGITLTEVAHLPKVAGKDPYSEKIPWWKKAIRIFCMLAVIFAILFFTDSLSFIGLPFHKEKPQTESVVETPAAAEEVVVE